MMYLSRGVALRPEKDGILRVSRCGTVYALGPRLAAIWRQARVAPAVVKHGRERAVRRLAEAGLVAVTEEEGELAAFRLLINCVLCPSYKLFPRLPLHSRDQRIWEWVKSAGLRLTASELIRLEEQQIMPATELFGTAGRQELTEIIYLNSTIFDGVLETEMEHSPARDETVASILKLLRTRRLILI